MPPIKAMAASGAMFHQWNSDAASRKIPAPNTIKIAKITTPFWSRHLEKSTRKVPSGQLVPDGSLASSLELCYRNAMFPSEQAYRRLQRRVDRLSFLIVATDISERDIGIERLFLRTEAARLFPERFRFYEMLYESRFRRLVEQFRHKLPGN
jgi:hypothetical protein